jgi:hypothetical protein
MQVFGESFGTGWNHLKISIGSPRVKKKKFFWILEPKYVYKSLSMEIFDQIFTLKTTNKIWLKLNELHDDTSNICEQKYCLL